MASITYDDVENMQNCYIIRPHSYLQSIFLATLLTVQHYTATVWAQQSAHALYVCKRYTLLVIQCFENSFASLLVH